MNVRAGTLDDIPAVLPLVAKTVAFHDKLDPARFAAVPGAHLRYEAWIRRGIDSGLSAFFVAEEGGTLIGFILGQVQDEYGMYQLGRYGMLHDLWVEPEHRRKGAGRGLVQAALERFRQAGVGQARLDTAAGNLAAQQLFAACGFRASTIEMLAEL
ncbi:MAG TPA: GNAT family N-acetyltransferase [Chloroflexota bacterium]